MANVTLRPQNADDDEWAVSLSNRLSDHLPPSTVERFRHWKRIESLAQESYVERFVAEEEGTRVGSVILKKMWWTARTGNFWAAINVVPERWGHGIGSKLYSFVVERLEVLQASRVYANVRRDHANGQRFVEKRGFAKTGHADRWSRLEVAGANLAGYEGVEVELEMRGVEIKTLADIGDEEPFLRKLHALTDEAIADIPSPEDFAGSPFEMFLEELREPGLVPERVWVAVAGEDPVGVVIFPLWGERAAVNGFTGVARAYRGKGIARALKLKAIEWGRAHGIEHIYTANDVNNRRMLAINNSLGYQELPYSEELVKELA